MIALSSSVLRDVVVLAAAGAFSRPRKYLVFFSPSSMNLALALVCAPRAIASTWISSSVLIWIFCCNRFFGFFHFGSSFSICVSCVSSSFCLFRFYNAFGLE